MTASLSGTAAVAPASTRPERWAVAAITVAFTALVAFWSVFTPLYDAPDEPLHFNSAIRLAEGGGWPAPGEARIEQMVLSARAEASVPAADRVTLAELREAHPGYGGVDQMTQHPPLYYAYAAAVLNAVDFLNIRSDLALLSVRLAGALFALPLPLMAWDAVRRLTRSPKAAVVAAASVFAVPQLAHIMGAVSNDGLAVALSSAVVWLSVRMMTGDARWLVALGAGLALALAAFTKGTTLPLVPYLVAVMLIWPREVPLRARILRTAASMGVALLGGWWWVRNLLAYGSLQPDGLVYPSQPWAEGTGPDVVFFLDTAWGRLTHSFWGNFGWLSHPLPSVLTDWLSVIAIAVVAAYAFRRSAVRGQAMALATLPVIFLVALGVTTWSGYVRTQLPAGLQGRYFFVVLLPLIALSAIAWMNFVRPELRRRAGLALLGTFAGLAALGLAFEYRDVYTGIGDMAIRSPLGTVGFAAMAVMTAALGAAALGFGIRFVHDRPEAVAA